MESQKKWFDYGNELTDAFSQMANFEKSFKPQIEKKIGEHDALESALEKLSARLTSATVDLDQKKAVIFADLREKETKIRSDLLAKMGTPTAAKKSDPPDDCIEQEVADKLSSRAKSGAKEIHERGLDCLRLERDLIVAKTRVLECASWPIRQREAIAQKFLFALFGTAGFTVPNSTLIGHHFDEQSRLDRELKRVELSIAIAEGKTDDFQPIGYRGETIDDILSFAASLPTKALDQLVAAWSDAKIHFANKIAVNFSPEGLAWRLFKENVQTPIHTTHEMRNFGGELFSSGFSAKKHIPRASE